jgi:hypothetical protein
LSNGRGRITGKIVHRNTFLITISNYDKQSLEGLCILSVFETMGPPCTVLTDHRLLDDLLRASLIEVALESEAQHFVTLFSQAPLDRSMLCASDPVIMMVETIFVGLAGLVAIQAIDSILSMLIVIPLPIQTGGS